MSPQLIAEGVVVDGAACGMLVYILVWNGRLARRYGTCGAVLRGGERHSEQGYCDTYGEGLWQSVRMGNRLHACSSSGRQSRCYAGCTFLANTHVCNTAVPCQTCPNTRLWLPARGSILMFALCPGQSRVKDANHALYRHADGRHTTCGNPWHTGMRTSNQHAYL